MNTINLYYVKGQSPFPGDKVIKLVFLKGQKIRLLKNWQPISILCVPYKIISGFIAEIIKPCLDHIISQIQSGLIKGLNMAENTRLIYDLMYYMEK